MPPVSLDTFTSHLRGLDRDALLAFLAAVWSERGWETTVTDGRVVAERADERVVIAPVRPGRFRRPALPDADVVVTTHADDRLATAAREAGSDFYTPADLRHLLLYGLPRDAATRLYEEHVGRPLLETADAEPADGDGWGAGWPGAGRVPPTRVVVAVALLLLAGGAAAGPDLLRGFANDPGQERVETLATFQPASTETPTRRYPPGLNESGVASAADLASAHAEAVRARVYELHVTAEGPPGAPFMSGRTAFELLVRIESDAHYRSNSTTLLDREVENGTEAVRYDIEVFADGETKYRRQVLPNGSVVYRRYPVATTGGAEGYADLTARYVFQYLSTDESSVECRLVLDTGDCGEYRVVATGDPGLISRNVSFYRAVAQVRPSGLVTNLSVRYVVEDASDRNATAEVVRFQFEFREWGSVTVEAPEWLDEAKNATSGTTASGTPTGTSSPTRTPTPGGAG